MVLQEKSTSHTTHPFSNGVHMQTLSKTATLVDAFITTVRQKGRAEKTLAAYSYDLENFKQFLSRRHGEDGSTNDSRILACTKELFDAYSEELIRTMAPRTVRRKMGVTRGFYKWLKRNGMVASNPTDEVPPPKQPERSTLVLRSDQVEEFLDRLGSNGRKTRLVDRDTLVAQLILTVGISKSELVTLERADFQKQDGSFGFMVRKRGRKNAEVRFVAVPAEMATVINQYIDKYVSTDADAPVFPNKDGKKISTRSIRRVFWKNLRRVVPSGIAPNRILVNTGRIGGHPAPNPQHHNNGKLHRARATPIPPTI
jgi:integrase/recombinase XerC